MVYYKGLSYKYYVLRLELDEPTDLMLGTFKFSSPSFYVLDMFLALTYGGYKNAARRCLCDGDPESGNEGKVLL